MLFQYETDRLILKILKPEHAALVLDFYNRDRELFELYETARMPDFYTIGFQQKLLRFEFNAALQMSTIRFYVFLKSNPNQIIGTVCLHNVSRNFYHSCEIGYKFSSQFHRQGYASEAITMGLHIAFDELRLHRIIAMVCEGNTPSMQLLNNLGFRHEGLCQDYLLLHNEWFDHHLYALTVKDYSSSLQSQ